MNLGSRGGARSDINVTPLIDVVLVLLIIFLVTMPVMMRSTPLEVPRKAEIDDLPPPVEPIVVRVRADLSVTVKHDGKEIEIAGTSLATTLRPILAAHGLDKDVFVDFEDPVPWGETVATMDSIRGLAADVDHNDVKVALLTRTVAAP